MKTKRILAALRKCKAALEEEIHASTIKWSDYPTTIRCNDSKNAVAEADAVLADWQAETLKKSEAFR